MCGSTKAPPVVTRNPVAEAKAADATAQREANSEIAARRRQRAQNSLLTLGATGTDTLTRTPSLLGSIQRGHPSHSPSDYGPPSYKRNLLNGGMDTLGGR